MIDQAKNIMIGIFVIAACTIVVFMILFLHPTVGDERKVLMVRFANIDKVNIGTRVTFAGKPVGEVVSIHELPDAINERKPHDGLIYAYELKLRVDSSVNVFSTDEISLRTSGLLGEKSVAILPLPPIPGHPLELVNNEVIYATETGSVEDTLKEFKFISGKLEKSLDNINEVFEKMREEKFWENLGDTAHHLSSISGALNQPANLSEIVTNFHTLSSRVLKTWDVVDHSAKNIDVMTTNGREIIANVKAGKGTVGKLFMSDDLYLRLNSVFSKGETMFNDINHYGLLFNLDKGWQRLRARRMNLLSKLSSPQEFRNYFNDEVDQISTSLSRVSMVLDNNASVPPCILAEDRSFLKVYAELLRRVKEIEESLQMYNQQLMDCNTRKTELTEAH